MCHTLYRLYGPFAIHSFGLLIALGIFVFAWLVMRDERHKNILSRDQFMDILLIGTLAGIMGCRVLYIFSNWSSITSLTSLLSLWEGGLSMLGGILGIVLVVPWYLARKSIPIISFFDLMAVYAPLIEAFARIGCFLAGCCYGKVTAVPWAITYHDIEGIAPLGIPLHPTQLYASAASFFIFGLLYMLGSRLYKPGQLFFMYLILTSLERLSIDFLRGDQEFFAHPSWSYLSINQWIALCITAAASLGFIVASYIPLSLSSTRVSKP